MVCENGRKKKWEKEINDEPRLRCTRLYIDWLSPPAKVILKKKKSSALTSKSYYVLLRGAVPRLSQRRRVYNPVLLKIPAEGYFPNTFYESEVYCRKGNVFFIRNLAFINLQKLPFCFTFLSHLYVVIHQNQPGVCLQAIFTFIRHLRPFSIYLFTSIHSRLPILP